MDQNKTGESAMTELERLLRRDYQEDLDAHDEAIVDFDAYEAMHMAKTYDTVSRSTKQGLTDSATATIYLERAARVAGQLPEGQVVAFGKKNMGKGLLMDILRQKWIYPNANAQRPFRSKMFLWQYGSSQYGYMPMYYDLHVSPSGYVGPDCWLWNPRNFIPQNGFTTISDMDYCHAIAYKSPSYFEDLLEEDDDAGWDKDAIREVIDKIKEDRRGQDPQRDTLNTRTKQKQEIRQIAMATRYEAGKDGRWVTFLPTYGFKCIRKIKNPHKNKRIPFVIKPCIPTFDSFYNIGDFQRSKPMQFANDGLDNFYFEGIKLNLFPPTVINANGVVRHTIEQGAGKVWQETQPNSIRRLETSTAGLATYQNAKSMAKGAIQSIAGTTDTTANSESSLDPGFGKTPEALKMISNRESTRDNQDRELLEESMNELIEGMMSLIPTMSTEDIPIDMYSKEIEQLVDAGYDDVLELLITNKLKGANLDMQESGDTARITIDPKKLKGFEYKFNLESNSTAKKTKEEQLQSLTQFMGFVGQLPNALQQYQEATGEVPNWPQIFKVAGNLMDVPGFDNIFIQAPQPQQPETPAGGAGGGISPEQLAQAAAMNPQDVAMGGMQPQQQAQQQPQTQMVGGMEFADPELAAQAAQFEAMKQGAM